MFEPAQAISAANRSVGDDPNASPQPPARCSYALRGRVRCQICQRRMCGTTRTSPRYWAEGPDYSHVYDKCSDDVTNRKHAAAHSDHPAPSPAAKDLLVGLIRDGLARHVFGPTPGTRQSRKFRSSYVADAGGSVSEAMHAVSRRRI